MHSLRIVHRDIKPESIVLENCNKSGSGHDKGDLSIKLIDLGSSHYYTDKEKLS